MCQIGECSRFGASGSNVAFRNARTWIVLRQSPVSVCLVVWGHRAGMEMDSLQKPIWHSAVVTEAERREKHPEKLGWSIKKRQRDGKNMGKHGT